MDWGPGFRSAVTTRPYCSDRDLLIFPELRIIREIPERDRVEPYPFRCWAEQHGGDAHGFPKFGSKYWSGLDQDHDREFFFVRHDKRVLSEFQHGQSWVLALGVIENAGAMAGAVVALVAKNGYLGTTR